MKHLNKVAADGEAPRLLGGGHNSGGGQERLQEEPHQVSGRQDDPDEPWGDDELGVVI
jgi:hypothetical protein